MNKVILIGRLAADPGIRYTQSGTAVSNFTLAVKRKFAKENEQSADFVSCVAWNKTAEFVVNYFKKGQEMALEGRLQVRSYETEEGQKRWVTEIVVEQVEFVGSKNNNQSTENEQIPSDECFTRNNLNQQNQNMFSRESYTNNNNFGGGNYQNAPQNYTRMNEDPFANSRGTLDYIENDLPF